MAIVDDDATGGEANDSEAPAGEPRETGGVADWMDALREVAPYLDLGWRLAGSAAFPPLIGYFLIDEWLGTTPWALLIGCAVGLAAAGLQLKQLQEDFGR